MGDRPELKKAKAEANEGEGDDEANPLEMLYGDKIEVRVCVSCTLVRSLPSCASPAGR